MNILIIGSSGFIGRRLLSVLKESGNRVFESSRKSEIKKIQISPYKKLDIENHKIDVIINAAGYYSKSNFDEEIFESQIGIATSIAMSMHNVRKGVINLNSYFELLPPSRENSKLLYTNSKKSSNKILESSASNSRKSYTKLYLFDNFDKDLSRKRIFVQIIIAALNNTEIEVKNTLYQLNLLPLSQIVLAIDNLIQNYDETIKRNRYDLKHSKAISIGELIKIIEKISKSKIKVKNLNILDNFSDLSILTGLEYQLNFEGFNGEIEKMIRDLNIFK